MNKFKKYYPNVWVAECEEEYQKGEIIELETKYGKEVECEVYNFLGKIGDNNLYSIVRCEDMTYAERKAEKYANASIRNQKKSTEFYDKSNENRSFLILGEPIKVGHHSEKMHRKMIENANKNMDKMVEASNKAEEQARKAEYWERKSKQITLAVPESLEYFEFKLEQAEELHRQYKSKERLQEHSYAMAYAKKDVNELKKKVKIAKELWGE